MRIERAKNEYKLILNQREAIRLICELGAGIQLLDERLGARIAHRDMSNERWTDKPETKTVAYYRNKKPERIVRIELEDLPIPETDL